ncbi:MAG: ankyrin repeat domain-containing protein, partial [Limnohabitans sp.]
MLQTAGATPLYIASQNGHVECVQALLGGGAAINQARVSCASS